MVHELPTLPWNKSALAPTISEETIEYHYGKHHNTYVNNLNNAIKGTEFEDASLDDIVKKATGGLFNNGAQHWNHSFYWQCMTPNKTQPSADLEKAIKDAFGSIDEFKQKFQQASSPGNAFGSCWSWLVRKPDGKLDIVVTQNAGNPLRDGDKPLFTCDLWEHAHYIDYRNARPQYVEAFWNITNWDFISRNFGE